MNTYPELGLHAGITSAATANPKAKKNCLTKGLTVWHKHYGQGVLVHEWGSWHACSNCYRPITGTRCTSNHCKYWEVAPIQVCARGTFDVLFTDGKTRAIHKHWLRKI